MGIRQTQHLVQFIGEHNWLTYRQYIQPIHPLHYIHCICTLRYPLHKHLCMGQVTLHHHLITHQQKAWHLNAKLCHATTTPIRYRRYQMTRIQIQVHQILLCQIHLTHQTTSILNKGDVRKIIKINSGVRFVSMTLSKSTQSLQPSYLQLRKNQRW